jgi:hypothetical protein
MLRRLILILVEQANGGEQLTSERSNMVQAHHDQSCDPHHETAPDALKLSALRYQKCL